LIITKLQQTSIAIFFIDSEWRIPEWIHCIPVWSYLFRTSRRGVSTWCCSYQLSTSVETAIYCIRTALSPSAIHDGTMYANNRVENSHQHTCRRVWQMQRFKSSQ